MPAPGEQLAAVVLLDDLIKEKSKCGRVVGLTTVEAESQQAVSRLWSTDYNRDTLDKHGESVIPCGPKVQIGWIWDGKNTFMDSNTGETESVVR
tara:strand:- start:114 stop:395 length:282 start_codon:yes stop_codon:yes gene_type:complete